ncbi:hypothetical protein C8J57DRAFT_1361374, partial [Mycena rebaudengoi]
MPHLVPTLLAAFVLAFTVRGQLCVQCPLFDNIGRRLILTTPLIPNAGICCQYLSGPPLPTSCYNPASALNFDNSDACPGQADPTTRSCFDHNF